MQNNDPKTAASVITQSLLNALGLNSTQNSSPSTSENLKELQSNLNKVLAKRKQLQDDISAIQRSLANLESTLAKKQSGINRWFTKEDTIENLNNEIDTSRTSLNNLKQELTNCVFNLDELSPPKYEDKYQKVVSAFDIVCTSNKIWDIVSSKLNTEIRSSASSTVDRTEVKFIKQDFEFIKSKYPALCFPNANGLNIYLFPTFIMLTSSADTFNLIDLKEINFVFRQQKFIEPQTSLPSDAEVIDYAWAKVNKDGSPDMRFKGNYRTPVAKYGAISLSSRNGLNELYNISNYKTTEGFSTIFDNYLNSLKGNSVTNNNNDKISEDEFRIIKEFGDQFVSFITKLQNDVSFGNLIANSESLQKLKFGSPAETITKLFMIDVAKCFNQFANINDNQTKEFFALLYLHTKVLRPTLEIQYALVPQLYEKIFPSLLPFYETLKSETEQKDIEAYGFFKILTLLSFYSEDLKTEYLKHLYQFSSVVVKADGVVTKNEEDTLKRIMALNATSKKEQAQTNEVKKVSPKPADETINEILDELNTLTGLENVKKEINTLINFIKIQRAREQAGLKSSAVSYHIVFTGNPGTGKTTVARIVAKIYKSLGILSEGQLVETDRSGLIAEYVGQTAIKVNKTVDSALNGVLFIDEAYSIAGKSDNDYGKEAVATLIKRMEDDRDKLIVILAGYTKEMNDFIETNPGFKSRFNRYIDFVDYTPPELLSIFESQCNKLDYKLTDEAKLKLENLFDIAYKNRDYTFGNGRFVRNVFEKTLESQANRIASIAVLDKEILTTIEADDIS